MFGKSSSVPFSTIFLQVENDVTGQELQKQFEVAGKIFLADL